ncbi:hypothetical protein FOZ61_008504 [Perkinsus olseni]|uniref:Leucine-rich repeat-containing protein 51 n=1 Tax=Perkinsus olseni TaxID=32597 RepID=A0A7J6L374_PEROL|nr:hypothetical protein FOZ61_008504 [Perkinsus olseni]
MATASHAKSKENSKKKDALTVVPPPTITYPNIVGYLEVTGEPLDFSFKELTCCEDMIREVPRGGKRMPIMVEEKPEESTEADQTAGQSGPPALQVLVPEEEEGNSDGDGGNKEDAPVEEGEVPLPGIEPEVKEPPPVVVCDTPVILTKPMTVYLKLNNNSISSLAGFSESLTSVMVKHTERLQILDLSFNSLTKVDADILEYPNLQALYLHGNCIDTLSTFVKLRKLPKLRSLTANGNPIESREKVYRLYLVGALTWSEGESEYRLKALDHSAVTEEEAAIAQGWYAGHLHRAELMKEKMQLLREQQGMS